MKDTVLSGMRPTGKLHLGHLVGALNNWIDLQEKYNTYYMVADWHAISTSYEDKISLYDFTIEMVADWLATGIDPEKSIIFVQSSIKQHAELHLLLSMITPLSWLERNPSYKEMINELKTKNIATYGFLGYPVLQAADIMIYKAKCVPVGLDQLPHLELCREIVRRFNHLFKKTFIEPDAILAKTPKLPGLDGRKMSKSYNNCIFLSDTEKNLQKKVNSMITDPKRIKKTDKGHPEVCSVFAYQKVFNQTEINEIKEECQKGNIGCVQCKKKLFNVLNVLLSPIREKKYKLMENKKNIIDILKNGEIKARETAENTMKIVRENIQIGL